MSAIGVSLTLALSWTDFTADCMKSALMARIYFSDLLSGLLACLVSPNGNSRLSNHP